MTIMHTELDDLQRNLNNALDAFRSEMLAQNLPPLSLFSLERHPLDNPDFLPSWKLYEARNMALACIGELKALLQIPYEKVVEQTLATYDSACLDIGLRTGVFDKLIEARHEKNVPSIQQLGKSLDLDPAKLTPVLRYLSTHGWLYETNEGHYRITRLSLEFNGLGRNWALTPGKVKVSSRLLDAITSPEWKYSRSPSETAFQLSHSTNLTLFQYLEANPLELRQWASSVRSWGDYCSHAVLADYPWKRHDGQTIVDCGGGQGSLTISLSVLLPKSKFVIEDLPEVTPLARRNLEETCPTELQTGRIKVQDHDLFTTQPIKGLDIVYVFRYIFHDWPDESCTRIFKCLPPGAKIVIIDYIVQPCTVTSAGGGIDSAQNHSTSYLITKRNPAPDNFGASAKTALGLGVHMLGVFNARERSMGEWRDLLHSAGVKITGVYPLRAHLSIIECQSVIGEKAAHPGFHNA